MNARIPLPAAAFAALFISGTTIAQAETLKVFLLMGQSNMEGQAYTYTSSRTDSRNVPTMEFLIHGRRAATAYLQNMPFGFKEELSADWLAPREDAWCVHYNSQTGGLKSVQPTIDLADNFTGIGPLSPGFGVNTINGSRIGPELGMGIRLAEQSNDPIFLFKSDRGGTTLANDWRPPKSVGRGESVGPNYTNTMIRFIEFLDDLDADLADDGVLNTYNNATSYEVAGAFWFQGWNEKFNDTPYTAEQMKAEYGDNLRNLIYSIRAQDPRIPNDLGLIIGESSDQDAQLNVGRLAAVAALNSEIPNSAAYFDSHGMIGVNYGNNTRGIPFTTEWGYHFNERAESYLEIGWRAGGAAIDLNMINLFAPEITDFSVDWTAKTISLTWTSRPGWPYAVEWSADGQSWQNAEPAKVADEEETVLTIPLVSVGTPELIDSELLFRVREE